MWFGGIHANLQQASGLSRFCHLHYLNATALVPIINLAAQIDWKYYLACAARKRRRRPLAMTDGQPVEGDAPNKFAYTTKARRSFLSMTLFLL